MESTVEKREFGFLWKIIGAFLFILASNIIIKDYLCPSLSLYVSLGVMGGLAVLFTIVYAVKLKPAVNQLLLFLFSIQCGKLCLIIRSSPLGFSGITFALLICFWWF